jgi:hypothetical protein
MKQTKEHKCILNKPTGIGKDCLCYKLGYEKGFADGKRVRTPDICIWNKGYDNGFGKALKEVLRAIENMQGIEQVNMIINSKLAELYPLQTGTKEVKGNNHKEKGVEEYETNQRTI